MTTSGGMVETGGEQDPFRSLNVNVLIKTCKLTTNIAIFRGWPLMILLGAGVGTGGE